MNAAPRLGLAVVVAVAGALLCRATETPVAAQQGSGLILNCVDWVDTQPVGACMGNSGQHVTVAQSAFRYIQGWQFDCTSGHLSYAGDVLVRFRNFTTGAEWVPPDKWLWRGFWRTDVYYAYHASCPNMPIGTGYVFELFVPPPVGDWTVTMEWSTFEPPAWGVDVFNVTVTAG